MIIYQRVISYGYIRFLDLTSLATPRLSMEPIFSYQCHFQADAVLAVKQIRSHDTKSVVRKMWHAVANKFIGPFLGKHMSSHVSGWWVQSL